VPASFRYCGACGARQEEEAAARPGLAEAAAPSLHVAERRQLTVMFADLVGSTLLAERLDPEDLRDLMRLYASVVTGIVQRHGGIVAEVAGDGTIAFFGYPEAQEDAAERAVLAGLAVVEGVGQLVAAAPLQVRVGIATGLMIVGEMIETGALRQHEIVGSPANLAARLQKLALPDGVVVSATTRRLIGDAFAVRDLGRQPVTGFEGEVAAFAVTGENRVVSRFEARGGAVPPSAMAGREAERDLLHERWRRASEGTGQVILLVGEPGIGKSRLIQDLKDRLAGERHASFSLAGSPLHRHTPFFAVARQLRVAAGIAADDSLAIRLDKLKRLLPRMEDSAPPAGLALLAAHCGSPAAAAEALATTPPGERREQLLEVVRALIARQAAQRPLLLVAEDMQWLDATTFELLDRLIREAAHWRMLLIASFRPEFAAVSWRALPHATAIGLDPLDPVSCRSISAAIARNHPLSEAVTEAIIHRTDGVPLFVEELTKAMIEAGATPGVSAPAGASSIPETLRDTLMARLDRVPEARAVAQIASAIGREFGYELLALLAPMPPAALHRALDELVASGLIVERGRPPRASYAFKHALIQDAAYESQLRRRRRDVHAAIARTLARHFPETPPDVLGHHHAEAGETEAAVEDFTRAAEFARARSANAEAAAHLRRALALLATLPAGLARDRQELALQLDLAAQLIALRGNAASGVGAAFDQAMTLARAVGEPRQSFRVLRGLQTFHIVRGDLPDARALGERLLEEAAAVGDDDLLLQAHRPHGLCLLYMGELAQARHHAARATQLYDPIQHASHRFLYNSDPGVLAHCSLAWIDWLLGQGHQAAMDSRTALTLAEQPEPHPHSQAFALSFTASLAQFRGEAETGLDHAEAVIALAGRYDFAYWRAWGQVVRGWALAKTGAAGEGLEICRGGLEAYRATESGLMVPYFQGLLAEAAIRAGCFDEGRAALDEAIERALSGHIRFFLPELYRLKAGLLATTSGEPEAALDGLRQALAEARAQGSLAFELRALADLCGMLADRTERTRAQAELRDLLRRLDEASSARFGEEARTVLATAP